MPTVIVVLDEQQLERLARLAAAELRTRKAQARFVFAAGLRALESQQIGDGQ